MKFQYLNQAYQIFTDIELYEWREKGMYVDFYLHFTGKQYKIIVAKNLPKKK